MMRRLRDLSDRFDRWCIETPAGMAASVIVFAAGMAGLLAGLLLTAALMGPIR